MKLKTYREHFHVCFSFAVANRTGCGGVGETFWLCGAMAVTRVLCYAREEWDSWNIFHSTCFAKLEFVFERLGGTVYEIHDGWAAAFVGKFMETSTNLNFWSISREKNNAARFAIVCLLARRQQQPAATCLLPSTLKTPAEPWIDYVKQPTSLPSLSQANAKAKTRKLELHADEIPSRALQKGQRSDVNSSITKYSKHVGRMVGWTAKTLPKQNSRK